MDLELADRAGLGAHDSSLSLVAEAPCHAADRQGDVFDAHQSRGVPHPAHVADVHLVDRPRTLVGASWKSTLRSPGAGSAGLIAAQAHSRLMRTGCKLAAFAAEQSRAIQHLGAWSGEINPAGRE